MEGDVIPGVRIVWAIAGVLAVVMAVYAYRDWKRQQ
jgi:hypothetical protein|tara:strand:- start:14409 stop:14516 length:108 start_codon:yes stop_codon:yes gene_type:complete